MFVLGVAVNAAVIAAVADIIRPFRSAAFARSHPPHSIRTRWQRLTFARANTHHSIVLTLSMRFIFHSPIFSRCCSFKLTARAAFVTLKMAVLVRMCVRVCEQHNVEFNFSFRMETRGDCWPIFCPAYSSWDALNASFVLACIREACQPNEAIF